MFNIIQLPEPALKGEKSFEEALVERRSVRSYADKALSLKDVSQLLWSAQGITGSKGLRTAPSAGALYPLSIYAVSYNVEGLSPGMYKYKEHKLIKEGGCKALYDAPFIIIIAADYNITVRKYEERGARYVDMETGHAAQNVCLQATALNLGSVVIGAFNEEIAGIKETPLYLIPVGKPL